MLRSILRIPVTVAVAAVLASAPCEANGAAANDLAVSKVVPAAVSIHIWVYKGGKAIPIPRTVLSQVEEPKLARLLRNGGRFHNLPPRMKGEFLLRVDSDEGVLNPNKAGNGSTVQYEYVSSTGDLGTGTDWYTAPPAFRKRIAALRAALPRFWFASRVRRAPAYDSTPMVIVDPRTIVDPAVLAGRRLTEAKAIAIARRFREQIRSPSKASATARFPAIPELDSQPDYHWQPRWHVDFQDRVQVEIVDATGTVSQYENLAPLDSEAKGGQRLPANRLIAIAREVLRDAGGVGEILPPEIEGASSSDDASSEVERIVVWKRARHGIPYRDQSVRMALNAFTGEPTFLFLHFQTPPPIAVQSKVARKAAEAKAWNYVRQFKRGTPLNATLVKTATLEHCEKMIVEDVPAAERVNWNSVEPGTARVAWVCMFSFKDGWLEVWVDAATGKVVGDDLGTMRC